MTPRMLSTRYVPLLVNSRTGSAMSEAYREPPFHASHRKLKDPIDWELYQKTVGHREMRMGGKEPWGRIWCRALVSTSKLFETHCNEVCRTDVRQPFPYRDYHQPTPLPIWTHSVSYKPRYWATPNCFPWICWGTHVNANWSMLTCREGRVYRS